MNTDAILAMLIDRYGPIAAEAGLELTLDGIASTIADVDNVLGTVPTLADVWHEPLARYFLMDRVVSRLAAEFNLSPGGGESYQRKALFDNAVRLRDEAYALASPALATYNATAFGTHDEYIVVTQFLTAPEGSGGSAEL